MKDRPLKDDWVYLLYQDLEKIGLSIDNEEDVENYLNMTLKPL